MQDVLLVEKPEKITFTLRERDLVMYSKYIDSISHEVLASGKCVVHIKFIDGTEVKSGEL